MPKLVCISDTHLSTPKIPDGDFLIHAGDLTYNGSEQQLRLQLNWLSSLPHRYKIFIAGNHDFIFESFSDYAKHILADYPELIYLQDSEITIEGIKFYGSPWQPRFLDWAFNLNRGEDLKQKWNLIPTNTDVLTTHGPPQGILDFVKLTNRHEGCEKLLKALKRIKPKVHLYGHIHEAAGVLEKDGTTYINASVLDDNYNAHIGQIISFEI